MRTVPWGSQQTSLCVSGTLRTGALGRGAQALGGSPWPQGAEQPPRFHRESPGVPAPPSSDSRSTGRRGLFLPPLGHSQKARARFLGVSGTLVQLSYFYASITLHIQFWIPVLSENVVITSVSGAS